MAISHFSNRHRFFKMSNKHKAVKHARKLCCCKLATWLFANSSSHKPTQACPILVSQQMNFTVLNNRLTTYMMAIKPGMKTRKKAAFRVYDDMPAASCQFLIISPQHLWPSGFPSPLEGLPFSHTTRDDKTKVA